jgi:long-subunit fatty acid transport protein
MTPPPERTRWSGGARPGALGAAGGLLAIVLAASAAGQPPATIGRFDFNFSNPGARSLGFGGAFAALADDATAAFANPAGLVQLTRLEVSLEGRLWRRSPAFLAGGRFDGEPTGIGIDTHRGIVEARDHSQTAGPSFAALVVPKGRWSFALYGHRLASFDIASESQGFFFEDEEAPLGVERFPATRERVDLEIVTAGAAAAWRMNDRASLGLGVVYSDASLATISEAFSPDDDSIEAFFGETTFLPERRLASSRLDISGADLTFNAGALFQITGQLSGALVYRRGAEIEGLDRLELRLPFDDAPTVAELDATLEVPDVWGGGLAYRSAGGQVTLAGEVDRVGYAGLVQVREEEDIVVFGRDYFDTWEYHLGAEYALLRSRPIVAFRLGAWFESNDEVGLGDRSHFAAGLGLAATDFQIDVAGDFSEAGDTASVSFIYSF